jgi:prevent-host-death family protein
MTEVTVTQARDRLAEVVEETRRSGEPTWITRDGQRIAVILDSEVFDRLVDLAEDVIDRRELEEVRIDRDYLPWAEVNAALGHG